MQFWGILCMSDCVPVISSVFRGCREECEFCLGTAASGRLKVIWFQHYGILGLRSYQETGSLSAVDGRRRERVQGDRKIAYTAIQTSSLDCNASIIGYRRYLKQIRGVQK
jgi:hypothetical protein